MLREKDANMFIMREENRLIIIANLNIRLSNINSN